MIACLRSAKFIYPDRSRSVFIELRRVGTGNDKNKFMVTQRMFMPNIIHNKSWDTIRDARSHWSTLVHKLEDQGMVRQDSRIIGFHEED